MEIKNGQVWIETVTPQGGGHSWERLHVVHEVKNWWLGGRNNQVVLSSTSDSSEQTELSTFAAFAYSGVIVDHTMPCVEQRTLEELRQIGKGVYEPIRDPNELQLLHDTAKALMLLRYAITMVGGTKRQHSDATCPIG